MLKERLEIGICGTFDVANYGDLLFPLIAQFELSERLGEVIVHPFSYHSKESPEWPYRVQSVAALPEVISRLDALLIGGGFLVRFDKQVAPGYEPPTKDIHHPTGYWLTPALLALQHNVPLIWNAPGMHCNEVPTWAQPLLKTALQLSAYSSVRDEPSMAILEEATGTRVPVVPDTAFSLQRLLNLQAEPSAEFVRLAKASGLRAPYIVVQATLGLDGFVRFLQEHCEQLRSYQVLALPIGPVLGEHTEVIGAHLPDSIRLPEWPSPLTIAELIGRSEAVVGHSYHLMISALTAGVPVFTRQDLSTGKYSALKSFETIFTLPSDGRPEVEWFMSRLGRKTVAPSVGAADELLRVHWDRIQETVRVRSAATSSTLNRFWQSLPKLLEEAAECGGEAVAAARRELADAHTRLAAMKAHLVRAEYDAIDAKKETARVKEKLQEVTTAWSHSRREAEARQAEQENLVTQLTAARVEILARDLRITDIMSSSSWRLTAPLRFIGHKLLSWGNRS